MEYRIFYSYQSDSPKQINELFIEKAIDEAIKTIKGAKIKLIKGFKGTSGQKPLADTMLQQSESSDIFIGDVTLTAEFNDHTYKNHWLLSSYQKIDKYGKVKKYPNGNVLLETGYSWANKDYDRTILVINEMYGQAKGLPVDMGHLRWPVTYNLAESHSQEEYDAVLTQLVSDLKGAIVAALKTTRTYHRNRFKPFKQHDVWKSSDFEKKLIVTNELKDVVNQLRNGLIEPGNPQRLLGPSKSGKTRIARELYNKIDTTLKRDEESLEKVLYHDLDASNYGQIQKQLQDIRDLNQDYIVILDNCPIEIHTKLCDELYKTSARILTIANSNQEGINDQATVILSETYTSDVIRTGVEERFSNPAITSKIIKDSGTNIEEAITYISSEIKDQDIIAPEYPEKWKQLLGEELIDAGALSILEELSLFTHIGINNHFERHSHFIVSNLPDGIDLEKFKGIVSTLANRGVLRIVGDFIVLDSFVEELALQRIDKFDVEQFSDYVLDLSKYELSKQFGDRLIELNKEPQADLIGQLLGEDGLLSDYKFINSDQGSQLIFKISELFPKEVENLLTTKIGSKSTDELKDFTKGRRNIVWCLEKLALIKDTGKGAIKLLYQLALAENESIANNATNAFIQIFQVLLSGTIVNLGERLEILKELKQAQGITPMILSAFDKGLQASSFYGSVKTWGIDKRELKSYDQEVNVTIEERLEYHKGFIELLEPIIFSEEELSPTGRQIIIKRFPEQYKHGDSETILATVQKIIEEEQELAPKLRHILETMVMPRFGLNQAKLDKIQELLDQNKPVEDIDKLKVLVIDASFKNVETEHGWKDLSKEEAQALAQEWFDSNNNTVWMDNLPLLLKGKQSQTFAFGEKLGEIYQEDENFINLIIENLTDIPLEEQNTGFIAGFIFGKKNDEFTRNVIDGFLAHDVLKFHTLRLTHFIEHLQIEDIEKLLPTLTTNPTFVGGLQYIKLNHLDDEEITTIVDMISEIPEHGKPICS